jgi:thioredoxin-disulfide reductase
MEKEQNSKMEIQKVVIIGGGPAGIAASIYLSRYKVQHKLFAPEIGGFMNETHKIENYPGFTSISGFELSQKMGDHIKSLGVNIIPQEIAKITKQGNVFELTSFNKEKFFADNVIYAVGTISNKLGIPGEKELKGKGVSYCATCDGPFFKNKEAVVVGGGNSAAVAVFILAEHADKVTLVHRGDTPTCEPSYIDEMKTNPKINIISNANIVAIKGDELVKKVILDREVEGNREYKTDGVFIEIGSGPNTALITDLEVELNDRGYIKVNPDQSTNINNFYAVGDISTNSNGFRQIITAGAEGAIAAISIFEKNRKNRKV